MKRYSQYEEDQIIADFFGLDRVGRFLDVGAHAAAANSNTRALMDRGWFGVCVEPSPIVFPYLLANVASYPGVECLNAAIDRESSIVRFHENNGDQMSTTEDAHRDLWRKRGSTYSGTFWIGTLTWGQVLAAFPGSFSFVDIDTEGSNLRVLRAAPLVEMGCEMVCVEKEPGPAMREYLRSVGYGKIRETAGNYLASRG